MLIRHTLIDGNPISCEFSGEFDYDCGVLVVGLGTAGAVAATASAKRGASVIGVDLAPIPGGVGTAACVWDYYFGADGGLYTEINSRADEIVAEQTYIHSTVPGYKRSYTTPVKALAIERSFEKYGVKCFYSCAVTDVFSENGRLCGAAFFDGERTFTVGAKVVVDGAEGAVCRLLGLKNLGARKSDGKTARFSRTVGVRNGDLLLGKWTFCEQYEGLTPEESAALTLKWSASEPCLCEKFGENNRLYALGCETGRREVLCYECEDTFEFAEYLAGRRNENAVFYSFSPLDNSNPDLWNENEDFQDWQTLCDMHAYGVSIGVSAGMLVAKGIGGLVLAGKHIGTGHTMTSTVRMRTDLEKCGEAAGVLAAISLEKGCEPSEVATAHLTELRDVLSASGCYNPANDRGIGNLNIPDSGMWKSCKLPSTVEELRESLASIHPALGLFSVRSGNVKATESLVGWLESDDKLLRESSAVALGLLGDRRCLPTLREILAGEVSTYVYESPEKYHFGWLFKTEMCSFVKAACLVARFNEDCDRDLLESLASYAGDDHKRVKAANYARVVLK